MRPEHPDTRQISTIGEWKLPIRRYFGYDEYRIETVSNRSGSLMPRIASVSISY
jgi:hypothetical protein